MFLRPSQDGAEVAASVGGLDRGDFLRRAGRDDEAARVASLGAEIDDVIGALDHIEIMLDDDQRIALRDEAVEDFDQQGDVVEVEAGGGLVEDEEAVLGALIGKMADQLEPLRFAAGEDIEGLAETEIAEADLLEDAQRVGDLLAKAGAGAAAIGVFEDLGAVLRKELDCFRDGGIEDVVDRFAVDLYFQDVGLEALAVTLRAADKDVAEELHLDFLEAVAGAAVAAALAGIEGKRAGGEAGLGRLGRLGEEFADGIECAEVNRRDSSAGCGRGAIDRRGRCSRSAGCR